MLNKKRKEGIFIFSVRKPTPADRDNFIQMCTDFYNSPAVSHPVNPKNFSHTFDELITGNPFIGGYIFERGSDCIGYALLAFTWSNEAGGNVVWLEEFYIKPAYRSEGYGSKFIEFLFDEYKSQTARFRLEVSDDNPSARRLYSRYGFDVLPYSQMIVDTNE